MPAGWRRLGPTHRVLPLALRLYVCPASKIDGLYGDHAGWRRLQHLEGIASCRSRYGSARALQVGASWPVWKRDVVGLGDKLTAHYATLGALFWDHAGMAIPGHEPPVWVAGVSPMLS